MTSAIVLSQDIALPVGLAVAALAGLVSHSYYRKREPSLESFLVNTVVVFVAFYAVLASQDSSQSAFRNATAAGQTCLLALTYLGALALSIVHYRVLSTSHPLHNVPGPLLAKISQGWIYSKVVRGQTRRDMQAIHAKYGDYVRIGPNEVSVRDFEPLLLVHGAKSWIKGASYTQTSSGNSGESEDTSLISLRNHESHTIRRKMWDKAFSMQSIRDYQVLVEQRISQLMEKLEGFSKDGSHFDLHEWLGYFVWDVMTDLAYGGGGDMIKQGRDVDNGIESLCQNLAIAGINKSMPWAASINTKLPWYPERTGFRPLATTLFQKRMAKGKKQQQIDVFFHLLSEGDEGGTAVSNTALAADSALVIAAGADTTRLVLATIFARMLRDPKRYADLQFALSKTLGNHYTIPTHDELKEVPLLDAYINEGLRLNPPVPFANQREAPAQGEEIGPYFITGGTQVRFACYAMHRDTRYFDKPDDFVPERWLPGYTGVCEKKAFFPFLSGPYHCPGRQFAMQEMRMLIAAIVQNFDMTPAASFDSYRWEETIEDRGLVEIHEPLTVSLKKRWTQ